MISRIIGRLPSCVALMWQVLACFACSAVWVSTAGAQDGLSGCWTGQLTRDGLAWDVRLHIVRGGGGPIATIGMDALWRARQPLPTFHVNGRTVTFDLPWSLGRFAGQIGSEALTGRVSFEEGRHEALDLKRVSCTTRREEDVTWRTDDVSIAGTLVLPQGNGPFPAVVVLHGGGDSSARAPHTPSGVTTFPAWGLPVSSTTSVATANPRGTGGR